MTVLRSIIAWLRAHPEDAAVAALGGGVLVVLIVGALCRGAPTRVEERKEATAEVHQVEAEHREEVRAVVRHVVTREERAPTGAVVIIRTEDERTDAAATSTAAAAMDASTATREVRIEERARPSWRLTAQAGWSLTRPTLRPELYGAELSRRLVGPLWLGAWARTDRTAGVSLALEW